MHHASATITNTNNSTMSVFSRMRCLDEFKLSSLSTPSDRSLDEAIPLPSATMSTAEYVRIHANIPPSKLREIIKKQVFPRDDVEYLKRIVGDIGDLEYVFRFLWWDGPKATSFDEWDDTPINFPQSRTCTAGWNESPTRGETNWGSSAYHGSRRRAATDTSRSTNEAQLPSVHSSSKFKDANRRGRTWIQYCCYYNAHQCLQWIFHEIVRNHLQKFNREQERQLSASSEHGLQGSLTRQTNSRKLSKEGDGVHIIHQVLEYPSHCYSATNYVAVSAIRNSSDCLYLLLQRGGLDPNMKINSHGSTAAHVAAWKNNVECLQVLKSGCCSDGNEDSFDEEFISQSSTSLDNKSEDGEEHIHNDSFSSVSPIRTWSADWNIMNDQGETPIHVAAREGCCESMQFFLDLAISFAEAEAMRNSYCHDGEISSRPHCLSEDGIRELGQHLDKPDHASRPPVDFSLRNKEGMDCTGLASKNNHAKIIEALANCIQQLKEIDEEASRDIKPSVSDGIWNNQQSLLETVSQDQDRTVLKPPPQSHLKSLRRRANTDPVRSHAELKLPKTSVSEHKINNQSSLPSYYPSLNRHNPQEKNNHEAPIHVAARQGNLAAIKALFESGYCDISGRDSMGQTALHIAVLAFHSDVIQFFAGLSLEQFKKFDVVDILGRTPLYIACSLGNSSIAQTLLPLSNWRVLCHEKAQSLDSPLLTNVAQGRPPLHAAVVNNHLNTVSALLNYGVDVDQLDLEGRTAIISAAKLGLKDMCQMLILNGADVNARSSKGGPTPYQKARKYRHGSVADLLYEFGGR